MKTGRWCAQSSCTQRATRASWTSAWATWCSSRARQKTARCGFPLFLSFPRPLSHIPFSSFLGHWYNVRLCSHFTVQAGIRARSCWWISSSEGRRREQTRRPTRPQRRAAAGSRPVTSTRFPTSRLAWNASYVPRVHMLLFYWALKSRAAFLSLFLAHVTAPGAYAQHERGCWRCRRLKQQ